MTEFELFQALRPFYPAREYALLPQVADGAARFGEIACRVIDGGLR
jgi:hypothetical protein